MASNTLVIYLFQHKTINKYWHVVIGLLCSMWQRRRPLSASLCNVTVLLYWLRLPGLEVGNWQYRISLNMNTCSYSHMTPSRKCSRKCQCGRDFMFAAISVCAVVCTRRWQEVLGVIKSILTQWHYLPRPSAKFNSPVVAPLVRLYLGLISKQSELKVE